MRRSDALSHANAFHRNLKLLLALGEHYLDEEVVLAFAANSRSCADVVKRNCSLKVGTDQVTVHDEDFCTAPFMDVRDICSHVDIKCEASADWGG
jgi:hypothetical protein